MTDFYYFILIVNLLAFFGCFLVFWPKILLKIAENHTFVGSNKYSFHCTSITSTSKRHLHYLHRAATKFDASTRDSINPSVPSWLSFTTVLGNFTLLTPRCFGFFPSGNGDSHYLFEHFKGFNAKSLFKNLQLTD